jgi:hypothetical protein
MVASPQLEGVGLGELIRELVGETFEAISSSQLTQRRQRAELLSLAQLSADDYAAREVTEDAVDGLLGHLFPSDDAERHHVLEVGAPYRPEAEGVPEEPPIRALTGIRLEVGDFAAVASKPSCHALMAPGVEAVRAWGARTLAERELALLRELARAGIPTVAVHKGRLQVKATYSLAESDSEAEDPSVAAGPHRDSALDGRLRAAIKGEPMDDVRAPLPAARPRLLVRLADERRADVKNLAVNVFGDVELEFILRD